MMARSLHPVKPRSARFDAWRRHLLAGCAAGATLAMVVSPDPARAQAFNATYNPVAGNVTRTTAPNTETITVNSPTAVINWSVNPPSQPGDPVVFLPGGNTATFQNGSGTTNFAVLNRIFNDFGGPVRFDGTVISRLTDIASGAALGPGGTVIFQSTSGIIVGSSAVFDVGNLVLTSLWVNDETGYGDFINSGGGLDLDGCCSSIVTEAGSQINATAEGSYVVFASPRIVHGGQTYVNGTAAYIGAENISYAISDGLFDIVVNIGSFEDVPIEHTATGVTTGPASTGPDDPHRIIMLAAPIDQFFPTAVTMLLSGQIGFEASAASVENGQIILSAGFDIVGSQLGTDAKYAEANIEITGGTFTSDVYARATGSVVATSTDGPLSFSGDFIAEAFERAQLSAINGAVAVGGDVSLTAYGPLEFETGYGIPSGIGQDGFAPLGIDVTGGVAEITAENGEAVTIVGNATLNASAVGEFDGSDDFDAGDGIGGTVRLATTTGGTIAIGGNLAMTATGEGAVTDYVPDLGGNGFGGSALINAQSGNITVDGDLFIDVSGTGSRSNGIETGAGAGGQGGNVNIFAFGADVAIGGNGVILARGVGGGIEQPDGAATGGAGLGGGVSIFTSSGSITLGSSTDVDISGQGGVGTSGGLGRGGNMFVDASGGTVGVGNLSVNAGGTGGDGGLDEPGNGGAGQGGVVRLTTFGSGGPSQINGDAIDIQTVGIGGNSSPLGGAGGAGTGGAISFRAEIGGGGFDVGDITANSSGIGGDGVDAGGAGTAANIIISTELGYGSGAAPSIVAGDLSLSADGTGGNASAAAGTGGTGTGALAFVVSRVGTVTIGGNSSLSADGAGGNGGTNGTGGDGIGGLALLRAETGGEFQATAGSMSVTATGAGGNGATGGAGRGGQVRIGANTAQMALAGAILVDTTGVGGTGTTGAGGQGLGGFSEFYAVDGPFSFGSAILLADGIGGDGATGGNGIGGQDPDPFAPPAGGAAASAAGGSLTGGSLAMSARGVGGVGSSGAGGDATGGVIRIESLNRPGGSTLSVGPVSANASATGGAGTGAAGGNADAGTVGIFAQTLNGQIALASANINAIAQGGNGVSGGNASGGDVVIGTISGNETGIPATGGGTYGGITANSSGFGGSGTTGNGGNGVGGSAVLLGRGNTLQTGSVTLTSIGAGGSSTSGAGGVGEGGSAAVELSTRFQTGEPVDATLGAVFLNAIGAGGTGVTAGASYRGFAAVRVLGGEADFASIAINVGGIADPINSELEGPTSIIVTNSQVNVAGNVSVSTTTNAEMFVTNGSLAIGGNVSVDTSFIGTGNDFAMVASNGTIDIDGTLDIDASGIGTASAPDGTGGSVLIQAFTGGAVDIAGATTIDARGVGNFGGAGTGGDVRLLAQGGNLAMTGGVTVNVDGLGSLGGAGTGGIVELGAIGFTAQIGNIDFSANGVGGNGGSGTGGAGTGGVATIFVTNDGELTFANASLSTDGIGGSGATGGTGTGGIQVNDPSVTPSGGAFISSFGGSVTGTSVSLSSRGVGGAGTAGAGGNGQGGSSTINVFNSPIAGVIDIGSATINNSATGGAGGTTSGGTGAAGGNAVAGGLNLAAAETLSGTLRIGILNQVATATGGAGGAGTTGQGGRGGDAFGGSVQAGGTSGQGSGTVNGVVEFGTVTGTASAVGGAGGANGGAGGDAQAGAAALLSRGGTLTANSVTFTANGTGGAGSGGAGGSGAGGRVAALLTTRFQTTIGSTSTIGAFTGTAGGTGGTGTTVGASRYGQGIIDVVGSTATFGSASLTTFGTDVPLISELAQPTFVRAQGGSLTFTTLLDVNAAQAVDILPEGGTIALQGTANIRSADSIAIAAIDSGSVSGGAWTLDTPGAVVISHSNRPGSGATVNVASLTAFGSDFTASSGTLVRASQTIGVNVASLATIAGTVVAPDIFIASSDIDIAGTGFLGDAGTTEITLSVNPQSAQTVIGGTTDEAGYTLTEAEIGRIRTASLEIDASPTGSAPSRPADLVIHDLTVSAVPTPAGGPGAINRLQISLNAGEGAGGIVQVEGALRIENATATSGVDIIAGERVQIVNPSGSIRVLNSAGLPAGSIGIQSANIWSASQAIIDQLVANPNFDGRNEALLNNDGDVEERGYIEAGDILFRVGRTLFVQNSGTEDAFAGITVTQNTLNIEPTTSGPIDVYAFGRRINADGTFVTNSDYFREVEFGYGTGAYASTAEFNLCVIATGACPGDPVTPEQPPIQGGPEIIEGPIDEVEESVPTPSADRQEFVDVSFASESLLEEPVTSGGDSGVWDSEDEICTPEEPCEPAGDGGN